MLHPIQQVHWSDDPYFGFSKIFWKISSGPEFQGGQQGLVPPSGRHQPQLDGLYRGLSAIRCLELGEDALQMPLDRREGEVQQLGYLAVRLARGDVAEDFRLPRSKRVGHRRR